MSKRRSLGEGTVFQLPNGRWVAMIELPRKPNGKRNRRKRRAATKSEAQRLLKQMRSEVDQHGIVSSRNRTLAQTLDEFVNDILEPSGKAKTTVDRDRRFQRQFTDYIGSRKTAEFMVTDCDTLLKALVQGELSPNNKPLRTDHARRGRSFLRRALDNDIRLGYLTKNVARIAVVPQGKGIKKEKRALTKLEWRSLFEGASGVGKLMVDLGGRHGLRPQEIRSLTWSGVDLDAETISVVNQFSAEDEFVDAKTSNSTRTIRLHPETNALLQERMKVQTGHKLAASVVWIERDLVLSTKRGTAINKDNQRRSIHAACDRIQLKPISPYELRHTAITHQIEAGYTVSQVADWAGTSEKMIYEHYRHRIREVVELPPVDHDDE